MLFQQLLNLKTKPLDSAIDDWVVMTKKLKELAKDAGHMGSYAKGTAWRGENASVTKPFVTKTAYEFQDAVTQAESITNLLKDAYSEFSKAKSDLQAIYENPPRGLTIAPDGVVSHQQDSDVPDGEVETLLKQMEAILQRAADADAACAWGLASLTKDPHEFNSQYYGSLKEAKAASAEYERTKLDTTEYEPGNRWGSGTIKPVAEFLSFRSWMNSGQYFLHGDVDKGVEYFKGGLPSAAGGLVSGGLEKNIGGGGLHRKPSAVNVLGKFGGKVFGAPLGVAATMIDFYYTPPGSSREPGEDKVVAPDVPSKVKYK
ncbi:hypothetical protein ACQB60_33825 [Actinomycetota bacterium Odt1-20B]